MASLFVLCVVSAQTITQKGVAYRYNGRQKRTPLGNVTISYDTNRRTTLSNEKDGAFVLTLTGLKMGDLIGTVTIRKREMMVFNQQAVDEWSVRKEPLRLILCNADEFERQKENLIAIGRREAKKKYDLQKAELESRLNNSEMKQQEYEAALDKAYGELVRFQKNVGEYADLFARIDESEIDTLAQQALEFFNKGEIDAAIKLFEQGKYIDRLKQARKTVQKGQQAISNLQEVVDLAESQAKEYLQSLKAQVEAYKLQGDWAKAGDLLHQLAIEMDTHDASWDYAEFCYKQNDFNQALPYYQQALQQLETTNNKQGANYMAIKSNIVNRIANVYQQTDQLDESEGWYIQALELRNQLNTLQPNIYENILARTIDNMGTLYRDMKDIEKSDEMHLKALVMRERHYASQPMQYGQELLWTLGNLGNNSLYVGNLQQCKQYYARAIAIGKELYESKTEDVGSDLAALIMQQGVLYDKMQQPDSCIICYQEALAIFRKEAENNANNVAPLLAHQLELLATYYSGRKNYKQAIAYQEEGIELMRHLANSNPQAYEAVLAQHLDNLSLALIEDDQLDKALATAEESVATHTRMVARNPERFAKQKARSEEILSIVKTFIDAQHDPGSRK